MNKGKYVYAQIVDFYRNEYSITLLRSMTVTNM